MHFPAAFSSLNSVRDASKEILTNVELTLPRDKRLYKPKNEPKAKSEYVA